MVQNCCNKTLKNKGYCILLENKKNSQFEVIAAEENRINSAYLKNFFNNE